MRRSWPILCLSILTLATPAAAQSTPAPAATAVRELCPGPRIQVALSSGRRVEGYCGFADSAAVPIRFGTTEERVPLESVDSLWVQRPSTGEGATIGGIAGFAAGALLGVVFVDAICENPDGCVDDMVGAGVLSGAVVGAGGALIGALLGSLEQGWSRRFP